MRKNIIILLLSITFSATAFAESKSGINCIWIKHANNSYSCVMLDTNPQFTFDGETVVIDSECYKIDDIVSYRFGNNGEAAVNGITDDDFHIVFNDNEIEVYNCKWNTGDAIFNIFDTKGNAIKSFTHRKTDQPVILNIADLTPGLYFLSAGGSSFKFIKK